MKNVELTLGATPSADVAGVVVGQDLVGWGKDTKLDVVVEGGVRGQTQESDVVSEELDHKFAPVFYTTTSSMTQCGQVKAVSRPKSKQETKRLRHQLSQDQFFIVKILK